MRHTIVLTALAAAVGLAAAGAMPHVAHGGTGARCTDARAADARLAADAGSGSRSGSAAADAENTGRNVRDRGDKTLTPMDQSESEGDRTITASVRKAVVGNDTLSTDAKNVKIITQNGVVTLRGPVKSAEERAAIHAAAQRVAGVTKVDDQLEIDAH